jgi:microcystin-dependent protein
MSGQDLARMLLDATALNAAPATGRTTPVGVQSSADKPNQLATVDTAYSGAGAAKVLFDGETVLGSRTYLALVPISASQRVVLAPLGSSYVILGAPLVSAAVATGTLIEGLWVTAPSGFLLLDASVVNRADYPNLYALLGTTYNSGGETALQFRLPDMRGRVTVGISSGGTFPTLGGKGGEESHILSVAEMPSHTHAPPVTVTYNGNAGADRRILATNSGLWSSGDSYNNVTSTGGGGSHNNLQPYIVINRAIKY